MLFRSRTIELRIAQYFIISLTLLACSSSPDTDSETTTSPTQPTAAAPLPDNPPATTRPRSYNVRSGDTLYSIARRFGITAEELQSHNGIDDPTQLRIGQRLRIPGNAGEVERRFIWPLTTVDISSGFGARRGHTGIDLRAPRGTPIKAAAAGIVRFVGSRRGYGKMVIIEHDDTYKTLYAHNLQNKVIEGERVRQGQTIATVGISGNATGYHVHFEVIVNDRPVNPRRYFGP